MNYFGNEYAANLVGSFLVNYGAKYIPTDDKQAYFSDQLERKSKKMYREELRRLAGAGTVDYDEISNKCINEFYAKMKLLEKIINIEKLKKINDIRVVVLTMEYTADDEEKLLRIQNHCQIKCRYIEDLYLEHLEDTFEEGKLYDAQNLIGDFNASKIESISMLANGNIIIKKYNRSLELHAPVFTKDNNLKVQDCIVGIELRKEGEKYVFDVSFFRDDYQYKEITFTATDFKIDYVYSE